MQHREEIHPPGTSNSKHWQGGQGVNRPRGFITALAQRRTYPTGLTDSVSPVFNVPG